MGLIKLSMNNKVCFHFLKKSKGIAETAGEGSKQKC